MNPLAFGPVAIECEHGFDVCPKCDLMVVGMCRDCVCLFYYQNIDKFGFCNCSHAAGIHQPKHEIFVTPERILYRHCAHCFDGPSPMICGFPTDMYLQPRHPAKCSFPKCVIGTKPVTVNL